MAESLLMAGVTVTSGEYCAASAIAKILYDPHYASTYSKNEKEKKKSMPEEICIPPYQILQPSRFFL